MYWGQEERIGVASETSIRDIATKSKRIDSSSHSIINFLFDFGGVPFLLWVCYFDSKVPHYTLPTWAGVLAPSLLQQWPQHPNLPCTLPSMEKAFLRLNISWPMGLQKE